LPKKVLFVCTGNTCRSPMAEGLLRKLAVDQGLDLEVRSAGLAAFAGLPVSPEAVDACRAKGVDISTHQTQPLGKTLVLESDWILTMTGKHKEMIVKKMPSLEPKVAVLSEFAGQGAVDVEDPVGRPVEAYQAALDQIEGYLTGALSRFKG
jgi:protein-tyrosine-phosphatase